MRRVAHTSLLLAASQLARGSSTGGSAFWAAAAAVSAAPGAAHHGTLAAFHLGTMTSRRRVTRASAAAMSTTSSTSGGSTFRVITYNLLSSNLDDPRSHHQCKREDLDSATRLQRIQAKLEPEMDVGAVLCLQEVSLAWVGALQVWLTSKGYVFIHGNYGNRFNGYMGVGIAYPLRHFEASDIHIAVISETKRWGRAPAPGALTSAVRIVGGATRGLAALLPLVGGWVGGRRGGSAIGGNAGGDPWSDAARRWNQLVFVRLRHRDGGGAGGGSGAAARPFCVATYHMPCAFKLPPMMTIHTALAAQHVARLAAGNAAIFAGDFNFLPDSPQYALVTTGAPPPPGDPARPVAPPWEAPIGWDAALAEPLRSAYADVCGEPELTNWSHIGDNGEFAGTLDYLFYAGEGLEAVAVVPVAERAQMVGPFPTAAEPSDHVMIGATFRMT